ncbi:hypothetical protein [Methanobrevibacter arboriphilus]|uniref:hypothetical protein n=1 Tax=Methanobrevibacter arboriphilus TaxID=39441 RepID=UPI0006D19AF6|nr:hypothetical protein [Methanobrevibacter arboriphilus]
MNKEDLKEEDLETFLYPYNYKFFSEIINNSEINKKSDFEIFEVLNKISVLKIENEKLKKEISRLEKIKSKKIIKNFLSLKNKI